MTTPSTDARNDFEGLLQFLYLLPVGVVDFRADGSVQMLNPAAVGILAPMAQRAGLANLYDLLLPIAPDLHSRVAGAGGQVGTLIEDHRLLTHAGERGAERVISLTVSRVEEGRLMAVLVDVTDRVAADQRFRALLESLRDPYFVIANGRIVDCNSAAMREVGVANREEVLALPPSHVAPVDGEHAASLAGTSALARELAAGMAHARPSVRTEWRYRRGDGRVIPLAVDLIPVVVLGKGYTLAVWHDLTDQQAREAELLQARDAAQAANEAKSKFLAHMSHELRTPLNAIIGFTRVVLKRARELSPANHDLLQRVAANGETLLGLINEVLDLAKVEAGHITVVPVRAELVALIGDTVARLDGGTRKAGVALVLELPDTPVVRDVDAGKLVQVVTNLVGNALKFTEQGSVTVRMTQGGDGTLVIEVTDTGIGIASDRLAKVFESFEQGDQGIARKYGGTGLGLAISRQLCERMGFQLGVTSTMGIGTTFRVTIPPVGRDVAA